MTCVWVSLLPFFNIYLFVVQRVLIGGWFEGGFESKNKKFIQKKQQKNAVCVPPSHHLPSSLYPKRYNIIILNSFKFFFIVFCSRFAIFRPPFDCVSLSLSLSRISVDRDSFKINSWSSFVCLLVLFVGPLFGLYVYRARWEEGKTTRETFLYFFHLRLLVCDTRFFFHCLNFF